MYFNLEKKEDSMYNKLNIFDGTFGDLLFTIHLDEDELINLRETIEGDVMMLRAEMIVKYNALEDAYIEAGNKLNDIVVIFMELIKEMKKMRKLMEEM